MEVVNCRVLKLTDLKFARVNIGLMKAYTRLFDWMDKREFFMKPKFSGNEA